MKKRSDGRYSRSIVTGYDLNGKQQRKVFYAKTKWELDKKVNEWKELNDKGLALKCDIAFAELCDMWLASKVGVVKKQSYDAYEDSVNNMKRFLGDIKATKLTVNDFVRVRNKMRSEGHISAFNDLLSRARQVLKYGMALNYLATNVAVNVSSLPNTNKKERRAFTDEERELILNADLDLWEKALVYTLFYTGIRRGEICALETSDILFSKRQIRISKTMVDRTGEIQQVTKTNAGMRSVPIPSELYDVLWKYVHSIEPGLLFPAKSGKPMRTGAWEFYWYKIMMKIFNSREITAHMFRHNYCSDLCKAGVPVRTAMYLMGHSSMNMTMELYSHVTEQDIDMLPLDVYYKSRESNRESKALKVT